MNRRSRLAPIQFMAIAFDNLKFDGGLWREILRLQEQNLIRIIDAVALARTIDDDIVSIEMSDLPESEASIPGSIIRRMLRLELAQGRPDDEIALGAAMMVDAEYEYGINAEEFASVVDDIPRRGGLVAVLLEHLWALPLKEAVWDSGGILLAQDFVNPEALVGVSERLLRTTSEH